MMTYGRTREVREKIRAAREQGMSWNQLAAEFNISRVSAQRVVSGEWNLTRKRKSEESRLPS
jgi:ribosome-binding protein aMBF1 (putative translation factor)